MEQMSKTFYQAFSLSNYNFDQAIRLYTIEIEKNDPKNHAAYFNRGICKINLAIKNNDVSLLDSAKEDITNADKMAKSEGKRGYEGAEVNLQWADDARKEIQNK